MPQQIENALRHIMRMLSYMFMRIYNDDALEDDDSSR